MVSGKKQIAALKHFWKNSSFFDPVTIGVFLVLGMIGRHLYEQYSIPALLIVFCCFCVGYFVEVERALSYCRKNKIAL